MWSYEYCKSEMMKRWGAPSAVCENIKLRCSILNWVALVQVKPTYPTVMVSFSIINFSIEPNEIPWSVVTFLSRDTVK